MEVCIRRSAASAFPPIDGLDYNKYAAISYNSTLKGGELNIRRQLPAPPWDGIVSILFGVRYVGLPEDLSYLTVSDVTSSGIIVPNGATNDIHVATTNEMIGPQVGVLFEFYAVNRWWVNLELKGAVLNNHSQETSTYANLDNGISTTYVSSQSGNHTSFAGELDLTCVYRWSPHFMTRLGYQAVWLTDMARAQDNFSTTINFYTNHNTQLNRDSGILFQGPFAGIELGW